ncbi:MAG: hypothetical protein OEM60_04310 [Gammaproteobacteria bacterium]|nr:hypothetical protein [Gammaproteobacteria bacterium]MDH3433052.1 hypothetical protein [Gammaproteobacteria bacterium]
MKKDTYLSRTMLAAAIAALLGGVGMANATEPCGDFGECKVLVEINSTDGDIGFHFLMDGDNLVQAELRNPDGQPIFSYATDYELSEQFLTETFAESAEPLCFDPLTDDDEENDDEDFVTLEEFTSRWSVGTYTFHGWGDGEESEGESELTFNLPAAPVDVEWEAEKDGGDIEGEISWEAGDDLGECSDGLDELVAAGLVAAPASVPVAAWEVVLEPDVEDGNILGSMKYVVRIPGDSEELEVEVPDDYLETLPADTPAKVEVGAIGFDDNATFTETDEICLNDTDPKDKDHDGLNGCGFEIEEDDDD